MIAASFLFSSCDEEHYIGKFYEGNFNDFITIVSEPDTANIVIEQLSIHVNKDFIPYSEEIMNSNTDSINLKLFVSFGGYNQTPTVNKETHKIRDTFFVWYSNMSRVGKALSKNNSIAGVTESLKPSFLRIDSIAVKRGDDKVVNLSRRLIK